MFDNSSKSDSSLSSRLPTVRVLIEDLYNGIWNENERIYNTRYGPVKRVRIIGTLIEKKDVIDKPSEDFFNAETSNSRISLRLDDGTGQIYGTLWGVRPEEYSHLKSGMTLFVLGSVRSYKNHPSLTIDYVQHLSNPNLETQHLLEILRKRKFEPQIKIDRQKETNNRFESFNDFLTEESDSSNNGSNNQENKEKIKPKNKYEAVEDDFLTDIQNYEMNANNIVQEKPKLAFNKLDQESNILNFISENDQGDGVSKKDISEKLQIDEKDLQIILDQMLQDIKIYKARPGYFSLY
jgi:RPA family protein